MDKNQVKQQLTRSINRLREKKGTISLSDIEAEVINNACLYYLENINKNNKKNTGLLDYLFGKKHKTQDANSVANMFTEAAMELFPNQYSKEQQLIANFGIINNVEWSGMWDFLRDYFQNNHGVAIDNLNNNSQVFHSSSHSRYESNKLVSKHEISRTITIRKSDNKEEWLISIHPSLTTKKSRLIDSNDDYKSFICPDMDYKFKATYGRDKDIVQFELHMTDRNVRIVYYA